jgi:hypothetical protein
VASSTTVPVYLEVGGKKVFASAAEWPGWCRPGRDADGALAALAAYAPRYSQVAQVAGLRFPGVVELEVVERVSGNATTDFGAPGMPMKADAGPLTKTAVDRLATLVEATWKTLDRTAAGSPEELTKGPRGGGRDRDKMVRHVLDAEVAYASKIGVRGLRTPDVGDRPAIRAHRGAIVEGLRQAAKEQLPEKAWPPAYAARRIAWHVLDHAWEMEDRQP